MIVLDFNYKNIPIWELKDVSFNTVVMFDTFNKSIVDRRPDHLDEMYQLDFLTFCTDSMSKFSIKVHLFSFTDEDVIGIKVYDVYSDRRNRPRTIFISKYNIRFRNFDYALQIRPNMSYNIIHRLINNSTSIKLFTDSVISHMVKEYEKHLPYDIEEHGEYV